MTTVRFTFLTAALALLCIVGPGTMHAAKVKKSLWAHYISPTLQCALGASLITASYIDNKLELEGGYKNYLKNFNPQECGVPGALLSVAKFWSPIIAGVALVGNGLWSFVSKN